MQWAPDSLGLLDVLEHLEAVGEELVVEEPVGDAHGEEDADAVHELPETKSLMITVVTRAELHEVSGDICRLCWFTFLLVLIPFLFASTSTTSSSATSASSPSSTSSSSPSSSTPALWFRASIWWHVWHLIEQLRHKAALPAPEAAPALSALASPRAATAALQDVLDQLVLEEPLPGGVGELGEEEEEAEQVGQPQVVGGDGRVLLGLDPGLVHEAAGCLALQVPPHVGRAVDPAVLAGEEGGGQVTLEV